MSHPTEEQLILHYYGEEGDTLGAERHLEECEECRRLYGSLQRLLTSVDAMPVPGRGADYGEQVWRRIEGNLPGKRWWQTWVGGASALRWAFSGAAMTALLALAFLTGRYYPHTASTPQIARDANAPERVLLVAMGDYLDRSQMVLVELANANTKESLDISAEQARVHDLISETRLYKQTAATTDNASVTGILNELERVLLDIAHSPSKLSPEELESFRSRLEAEGILFKIRVVNSNVRSQEEAPAKVPARQKL